jgi:hypothetical protein
MIFQRFSQSKHAVTVGDIETHFPNVYRIIISYSPNDFSTVNENISVKAKSVHDTFLVTFQGYQRKWANYWLWGLYVQVTKLLLQSNNNEVLRWPIRRNVCVA